MKKIRSRRFYVTLRTVLGASALFLTWLGIWGRRIAMQNPTRMIDCVMVVFGLAAASFLLFCFLPYFKGDRRWFSISGVLTAVFFVGATMVWNVPTVLG